MHQLCGNRKRYKQYHLQWVTEEYTYDDIEGAHRIGMRYDIGL